MVAVAEIGMDCFLSHIKIIGCQPVTDRRTPEFHYKGYVSTSYVRSGPKKWSSKPVYSVIICLNNALCRIFQSQGGSSRATVGFSVRRPPLIDVSLRVTGAKARQLDVHVDRTRLNLALPFLLQLARSLLDAMPGDTN